jgi:CelD/BcsL family acetyltransferase involved in cellulose biosynthesis
MKAGLITDVSGIGEVEDEWRALAESRGNGFVTPEWFRSWWAHRGSSSSPLISVARRDDGSVAGVMPLVLDASSRPRAIRFAGATLGDRFHPAAAEADEDAVAAATMAALEAEGVHRYMVLLEHVELERGWWREMRAAASTQRAGTEQQHTEVPYISLDGLDWDGYLAGRSKNFRQQVRRRERGLRREHRLEVRSATAATLEADLATLFELHSLRWSERGRSSLEAPESIEVVSDFTRAAARRDWLRLRLLEVDGDAVAAFLGWRVGGSYAFFQSGFDPAWSDRSVGLVLMALTVRSAIEEGAAEFDMLLGTEAYKRRFTDANRPAVTVALPPAMRPVRLLVAGEATARRLGRGLAQRRGSGPVARRLRSLLPTRRRS